MVCFIRFIHHISSTFFKLYDMQGAEAQNIAKCLKSKDFTSFQASGIFAEGKKYQFLREEDGKVVYGKLKGNGGITLQASRTAVVIAHCPEGSQQGNANKLHVDHNVLCHLTSGSISVLPFT